MDYKTTEKEESYLKIAEKIVEEWRTIMKFDPIWEIPVDIVEDQNGHKGAINIRDTEYYKAPMLLYEHIFDLDEASFISELAENLVPHELTHLLAVDFFRTALLLAGDNEVMKEELRYRYEQFAVRFSRILVDLKNENLRLRYELERTSAGTEKKVL
jgi:hypothetical protein